MLALIVTAPALSNDSVMLSEIKHLLEYVKQTDCQFERNGKSYNGNEATGHIKKKYDYHINDIDSAEKFIELSATKSMMSGIFYMIVCKDKPKIKSRDWLLQELTIYRTRRAVLPETR